MFNNIYELRELIVQGKTNEEIINARLEYLNSDEYKVSKQNSDSGEEIVFYDGFIPKDYLFTFNSAIDVKLEYSMDVVDLYNDVINYIRDNIDKIGINIKGIIMLVDRYYEYSEEKIQYKDLSQTFKEWSWSMSRISSFMREELPYLIYEKEHSNFDGNLVDFYIGKRKYENDRNSSDSLARKYHDSIDWNYLSENDALVIKLSNLKGTGAAMCTEKAATIQNIFSFLGYDAYMLAGELTNETTGKVERHNFNVVKTRAGYNIVDAAMYCTQNIGENVDLKDLGNLNIDAINFYNQNINYKTNFELHKNRGL